MYNEISEFITNSLNEGYVVRFMLDGNGVERLKLQEFISLVDNSYTANFVGMENPRRLGVLLFQTAIEMKYFEPRTDSNKDFQVYRLKWSDSLWSVVSIPKTYKKKASKVAEKCHLKISKGIPTEITKTGLKQFPCNGKNVFSLETHKSYKSNPFMHSFQAENLVCNMFVNKEIDKIPNEWLMRYSD